MFTTVFKTTGFALGVFVVIALVIASLAALVGYGYVVVSGLIFIYNTHGLGWCIAGSIVSILFVLSCIIKD